MFNSTRTTCPNVEHTAHEIYKLLYTETLLNDNEDYNISDKAADIGPKLSQIFTEYQGNFTDVLEYMCNEPNMMIHEQGKVDEMGLHAMHWLALLNDQTGMECLLKKNPNCLNLNALWGSDEADNPLEFALNNSSQDYHGGTRDTQLNNLKSLIDFCYNNVLKIDPDKCFYFLDDDFMKTTLDGYIETIEQSKSSWKFRN